MTDAVGEPAAGSAPEAARTRGRRLALGGVLVAVWVWHTAGHVLAGHPGDALWCCIVGEALVALGLLAASPRLAAVGTLWLVFGLPLFFISVAAGEAKSLASWVTHLFGPIAALGAIALLGFPRGSWWRAALGLLGLQAVTRLVTSPDLNVNLVFAVYGGWERVFPSFAVYQLSLVAGGVATFGLLEGGLRRLVALAPAVDEDDRPGDVLASPSEPPAPSVTPAPSVAPSGARR